MFCLVIGSAETNVSCIECISISALCVQKEKDLGFSFETINNNRHKHSKAWPSCF